MRCEAVVQSPALGALTVPLCARGSESVLEPVEVEGPGLLSMATSDTAITQPFHPALDHKYD